MECVNLLCSGLSYKSYKIDKAQKDHTMHQSNIHIVILSICKCFFLLSQAPNTSLLCAVSVKLRYMNKHYPQFEFDLNPRNSQKGVIY